MPPDIEVIAPNFKRRISGVTATIVRLIPLQARLIGITTTGPGLPADLPHLSLWRVALLPNSRWRVFHARRNLEMLVGILLRDLLRRRLRLVWPNRLPTRVSQRTVRRGNFSRAAIQRAVCVLPVPGGP